MAAPTGADAISAAASRSASFRMITTKRFSTNLAKNPTRALFPGSVRLACLSEGLLALVYLQRAIRKTARVGRNGRESWYPKGNVAAGGSGHDAQSRPTLFPKLSRT